MLLALGISVALPQSASATVVGWKVTNWCAPVACDPTRTYYQGMPRTMFTTNAGRSCASGSIGLNNTPTLATNNGGYLNPPEGFFASDKFRDPSQGIQSLRWVAGEPIVCQQNGPTLTDWYITIPFRYYRYDPVKQWIPTGATGTWELGSNICIDYTGTGCVDPTMTLSCSNSANTTFTSYTASGLNVQLNFGSPGVTSQQQPNSSPVTTDGKLSYRSAPIGTDLSTPVTTNFRTANCALIVAISFKVPTDTIGGFKEVQWSGARAMNGIQNTWSDDIETLDCNVTTPPIECVGQGSTPYLVSCSKLTIDPATWGELGPCIFGTPADYIRGVGALSDSTSMPLPGTGSCSPWNLGTLFSTPFVLDLCSWYPTARPVIDVLMTAGLWISVIAAVFRTRTGENG